MDTGEWLDQWLETKLVTPRTMDKYASAVTTLKESLAFTELAEITTELADKAVGEDQTLRTVLAMALGQAVNTKLLKTNVAAAKREQRKPQEGSLYYRPDRRAWVAQVTLTDPNGKQVKSRTKNPSEAAIRALEELKKVKSGGGLVKGTSTVGELIEEWLASIRVKSGSRSEGLARTTFEQYESLAKHQVIPWIGKIKVKDLTRVRVDRWLKELEATTYAQHSGETKSYSANTLRLSRVVLGMALKWAMQEGIVSKNVVRESRPPGGRPRPEKNAMSEDQAKRLIEGTRESDLGALWALMVTTGLRRGEALGLRWLDFDGESITVTSQLKIEAGKVTRGDLKTDRSKRRIRLTDFLIADLEAHRQAQFDTAAKDGRQAPDLIFTNSQGGPIRPDNLRKRFIAACNKAGIEPHEDGRPWSVHELRHTAASQLLNDRVPVQIVSKTLGHSSITVTLDVYSHLTDQDSELVADSMSKRYGPSHGTNE